MADRLEKIAYNSLPGTFTDDMWAHQYDQQSNQVQVGLLTKPWTTNGPESNLYGLAPHFGCCTANYHQGWPKFTSSLWMKAQDEGLVAAIYAPCEVTTEVRSTRVTVVEETEYPFRGSIRFAVNPSKPVSFPLSLRVPHWADGAKILVNGQAVDVPVAAGTFARIDRQWKQGDRVELTLPLKPRISRWFNRSVAVERGPIVFSYDPGEEWVKLRDRGPTADWQVFPQSPWNYALDVHEASAEEIQVSESPVGARPFAKADTPVRLHVPARRLDTRRSEDSVATAAPPSPVGTENPQELITLVPYASAKLRITAFPSLRP